MRGKGRSLSPRPEFPKKAIVTAGMPYGNKGLHFGHVGGVFIPADIYARFLRDRIGRDNVLFVSGTDCYGSPIMEGYRKLVEAGEFEGSILDYVQGNHDRQKATLDSFGISLDIYEGSALGEAGKKHDEVTDWFIRTLYENGWLEKRSTPQFYDTEAQT
ncbi:MAG: class I tRNA ligase family protein, partial [Coriobacteriales bacterium]